MQQAQMLGAEYLEQKSGVSVVDQRQIHGDQPRTWDPRGWVDHLEHGLISPSDAGDFPGVRCTM